jgi:MFS family permease
MVYIGQPGEAVRVVTGARRAEPDTGTGWAAVAMAFVALAAAFGVIYNYGSLVNPMSDSLHVTAAGAGSIFSVSVFMFLALGAGTGRLADRYGPRPLLAAAGVLIAAGLALTSTAGGAAVAIAGYVVVGAGVGCAYVPAVANVGAWFVRHRAQAIGITVSGIGVGTVVGPVGTAALVAAVGWRRANVYIGAFALLVLLACALAMPIAARRPRTESTWTWRRLAADRVFRVLYLSNFAVGLALFVPFVFLVPMAEHAGIAPLRATALVSVVGLASTVSRPGFGLLASRLGVALAYKLATATTWLSFLIWLVPVRSYAMLLAFALIFGTGYGGGIALSPALLGRYYGVENLGTAAGALYTSASVGSLFGAPLAGLLIGTGGRYPLMSVAVLAVASLGTVWLLRLPETHPLGPPDERVPQPQAAVR